MFLDGSVPIIVVEGFAHRDLEIIGGIIFNDAPAGDITNDQFLLKAWEDLHEGP